MNAENAMNVIKDIVQWKYERASWQWDVLCVVCLIFIFLTPKSWFDKKENLATQTSRLIVKAEDFPLDKSVLQQRIKELSGNENAEIVDWHKKTDTDGKTIYEIDIR